MRIVATAALAAMLGGCLPEKEPQLIVVDGEGVVMAAPDIFNLNAEISAVADTQADVLDMISQSIDKIGTQLPALEGLQSVGISSASVAVSPVRDNQCVKGADYQQRDACPIVQYQGNVRLKVKGSPAEIAGNALSYLNELGAIEVQLVGYSFSDNDAQRTAGITAALKDARTKALRLAEGMEVTLGEPFRVQYGEGLRDNFQYDEDTRAFALKMGAPAPPAERLAPRVALSLTPQSIEIHEKVTAAFAIMKSAR